MYHKKIETKKDAIDYIRTGEVSETLNRLDNLPHMIETPDTEEDDSEDA